MPTHDRELRELRRRMQMHVETNLEAAHRIFYFHGIDCVPGSPVIEIKYFLY